MYEDDKIFAKEFQAELTGVKTMSLDDKFENITNFTSKFVWNYIFILMDLFIFLFLNQKPIK